MKEYKIKGGQLMVVDEDNPEVVFHTQPVKIEGNLHHLELVATPVEDKEVRIPLAEILGDGTPVPKDFEASALLAHVTGDLTL